jgi:tetratricopeptide (TPR) repeat protein
MAWAYSQLRLSLRDQGKLAEAEQMYSGRCKAKEKALGSRAHVDARDTVNNLGILYGPGQAGRGRADVQRALQGYEKALGPEHTSTLETVNNLGILYADQGKLGEAEQMYSGRCKATRRRLDRAHIDAPDGQQPRHPLRGTRASSRGRADVQRALQGKEKALGPEHTSTLQTVNNLGILYKNQGKLGEAEQMYSGRCKARRRRLDQSTHRRLRRSTT